MTMLEKYRELAVNISTGYDIDHYIERAKELLQEDFVEQVKDLWAWNFTNSYNAKENRKEFKERFSNNKIMFVSDWRYDDLKSKFLLENWNKIDEIINILNDFIQEIEKDEAKEVESNE